MIKAILKYFLRFDASSEAFGESCDEIDSKIADRFHRGNVSAQSNRRVTDSYLQKIAKIKLKTR